jgi:orotidine-5'-phosphate decarboxylase
MKSELIVALDVPDVAAAVAAVKKLPAEVQFVKVGLELFVAEGPDVLNPIAALGKKIFLDLKLHDIPRTVERAVQSAAKHNVFMLTLHAAGGRAMLRAAADAAREHGPAAPKLVAVTVLTSLDQTDLNDLGTTRTPAQQVMALGELAISSGVDGLVCSAQEVGAMRQKLGSQPLLVTPGIRLPSDAVGDQKRVATPASAVKDGASFLVVGRPILEAADPAAAARAVLADMQRA